MKSKKILRRLMASIVTAVTLVTVVFAISVSANEEIIYTDTLNQYKAESTYDGTGCTIPVTLKGSVTPEGDPLSSIYITVYDNKWNYLGTAWSSWDENEAVYYVNEGYNIYIASIFSNYKNNKFMLNGKEVEMSESSSHFDYTYNVKDTDAALSFEFVYSPWSEERLNSYTYINNTTNGNIFDKLEEEIRCAVSVAGYSPYIRDNSLFSVAISPTDYKENYVLKVNGVEYDLVGYTETNLYESIKIWSDYSSYYFTDAIVVPENVSELIVTYESATKNEVAITTQPTDYTGAIGATATFIVKASGDNLTYQWQQNTGSGWANINTTAGRKASFSIGVTAARAKYQYRCVVSDGTTSVTSNAVKMVVKESLAITTQPTNYTGAIGATATFTVKATGATSYQWQQNTGAGWTNINTTAGRKSSFSLGVTAARAKYQYRCVVSDGTTSVTSNAVKMIVKESLAITTQPTNYTGAIGATATFTVKATGATSYQWQQNTGAGWANINTTAGRKSSFSLGVTAARAKYQYRCVVSDGTNTVTSNAVKMIVKESLAITTQPTNYTGKVGDTAKFTVAATGATSYQWQQNTGAGWTNINTTVGRSKTFSIGVTTARAKYQYRCVVSDGTNTVTSNAVKMVVAETLAITTQPTNYTGAIGDTAKFTVGATGATSYQWYQNTGAGWTAINTTAGRSKTFSVGVAQFRLGYKYRCVVSDGTNTLTSNEVQMILG